MRFRSNSKRKTMVFFSTANKIKWCRLEDLNFSQFQKLSIPVSPVQHLGSSNIPDFELVTSDFKSTYSLFVDCFVLESIRQDVLNKTPDGFIEQDYNHEKHIQIQEDAHADTQRMLESQPNDKSNH